VRPSSVSFPHSTVHRLPAQAGVPLRSAALAAAAVLGVLGGCSTGALERPPSLGALMGLLAAALLLNGLLTAVLLAAWERLGRRRRLREGLLRELEHLSGWASEEGVRRKAGLLRELDALGVAPRELDACELEGADLRGLRLAGCSLRGANLAGADLQGAVLDGSDCFGARLAGANLALASLRGANLRGCELDGAALIKADLAGANLHRASLVHANLHRAALGGARLTLARFLRPEAGGFQLTVHPSVEDWIRARLDAQGRYRDEGSPAAQRLPEAG
jgi:Pentapeptide repeats (8 copies)